MFTGIVTEVGVMGPPAREAGGWRVRIEAPATAGGLEPGGSVAVDGVCLTAVRVDARGFEMQVVAETARCSTLGAPRTGRRVNLERPMTASAEVGGHFVQGHVDAMARVLALTRAGGEVALRVSLPAPLQGLVVPKGSIAINGVSLTVARIGPGRRAGLTVALIPHTLKQTNLGDLGPGDAVNLEADILGKYVAAQMEGRGGARGGARRR